MFVLRWCLRLCSWSKLPCMASIFTRMCGICVLASYSSHYTRAVTSMTAMQWQSVAMKTLVRSLYRHPFTCPVFLGCSWCLLCLSCTRHLHTHCQWSSWLSVSKQTASGEQGNGEYWLVCIVWAAKKNSACGALSHSVYRDFGSSKKERLDSFLHWIRTEVGSGEALACVCMSACELG